MTAAIQVEGLSKRYRIGSSLSNLRSVLSSGDWWTRKPGRGEYHWAVRDVSFDLQPGEALGIIGPNGAGKTTILKILSRVTKPTSGRVHVAGRLSALVELGAGFHPDLTGKENVFLNGVILGMRKSDIQARFNKIVEFAGIGNYLDTPVKRYSSGMYARLGFAIAAHMDPQILLVDEVLAVGDHAFQMKCYARMDKLRDRGTSLIFISHNMEAVRRVCRRGLVMYRGQAIFQGTAAEAVVAYSDAIRKAAKESRLTVPNENGLSELAMTFDAEVQNVSLLDAEKRPVSVLRSGSAAAVAIDVLFHREVRAPIFAFAIRTTDGRLLYNTTTRWMKVPTPDFLPGERCRVEFSMKLPLLAGEYEISVDIASADLSHYYDRLERAIGFGIEGPQEAQGLLDVGATVEFIKNGRSALA
ncbi:MAG: ABC transporter ATP-binding protein [Acidobacteria bacterium]|nr:ABC transporter ATP-binding protein [Acidobacteriota bacterium]